MPSNLRGYIIKEQIIFDDENNPSTSPYDVVWPVTSIDAVIDQNTEGRKTLREILGDITRRLEEGPDDIPIDFPVRSVRGEAYREDPLRNEFLGDVIITRESLGLQFVDNTPDISKPISTPQRQWIEEYVEGILTSLYYADPEELKNHIENHANPHGVTFEQINIPGSSGDGIVTEHIRTLIREHSDSDDSHSDIRAGIGILETDIATYSRLSKERDDQLNSILLEHMSYGGQDHVELFDSKENRSNKAVVFSSPYILGPGKDPVGLDHDHYPTTLAVANYIEDRLNIFANIGTPGGGSAVVDIRAVENESQLPIASVDIAGAVYFIRDMTTDPGWAGIAVCRNVDGNYTWDIERYVPANANVRMSVEDFTYDIEKGWKLRNTLNPEYIMADITVQATPEVNPLTGANEQVLSYTLYSMAGGRSERNIIRLGELATKSLVYGENVALETLGGEHIRDRSIVEKNIGTDQVSRRHIQANAVDADRIESQAIRVRHIPYNDILSYDGNDETRIIRSQNIFPNSIYGSHLTQKSVDNSKLADAPGLTIKGRINTGTGPVSDIPISAIIEHVPSSIRIISMEQWPTDMEIWPIGSTAFNSFHGALGIRISQDQWATIEFSNFVTV